MSPIRPVRLGLTLVAICAAAISNGCEERLPSKSELEAQQKREAVHQSQVDAYAEVIKPGMTRKQVEDYLRGKKIPFQQMCCVAGENSLSDLVKIGTDKKPWFCSEHDVFAAIQFATVPSNERHIVSGYPAFDTDVLKRITVFHWLGGCL